MIPQYPLYKVKAKNLVNLANNAQQFMAIPKGMSGTLQAVWDPSNLGGQNNILIEAKFPVPVTNGQYGFIRFAPKFPIPNNDLSTVIGSDFTFSTVKQASTIKNNYLNAEGSEFDISKEIGVIKTIVGFTLVITTASFISNLFIKGK